MSKFTVGSNCQIDEGGTVGYEYDDDSSPTGIGYGVVVGEGNAVCTNVILQDVLQTGHDVIVHEHTEVSKESIIGPKTVIGGYTETRSLEENSVTKQPAYNHMIHGTQVAERAEDDIASLPVQPTVKEDDIEKIAEEVCLCSRVDA
jgi:UDP-3-O-[3-hydroxymyristoyl] glucosamine N-acyltransferase